MMTRPDPIAFAFAIASFCMVNTLPAQAADKRIEYRYPDRPDIVFSEDGMARAADPDRPMAFSNFEAAISVAGARSVTGSKPTSWATETPRRLDPPAPQAREALVSTPVVPSRSFTPTVVPQPAPAMPAPTAYYAPPVASAAYTIQAGAFSSWSNANQMVQTLSPLGDARIVEGTSNGRAIYRVMVGGFANRAQAKSMLDQLLSRGYDGFITSAS